MTESPEINWRLDVAYDGEPFYGFQSQPDGNTVQDHLEKALTTILRKTTKILGGSRTDSGVHAENQVCMFSARPNIDALKAIRALNALLPKEIRVYKISNDVADFHPHGSSCGKIYRYLLWKGFCLDPFASRFVWEVKPDIDVGKLKRCLVEFEGTHDFISMSNTGSSVKTSVRNIVEISVAEKGPLLEIWVHGEGFLKQMVRNIVGTAVGIALGKIDESPSEILAQKSRKAGGETAPAQGLSLVRSIFKGDSVSIASEQEKASLGFCHSHIF